MPHTAIGTKEVKHVSADHMMVRHSVLETIFQVGSFSVGGTGARAEA